jgi:hypothetical protein
MGQDTFGEQLPTVATGERNPCLLAGAEGKDDGKKALWKKERLVKDEPVARLDVSCN